jgi:hypothetical protein
MTYTSDEGHRELLGATAEAADTIAVVLAALGEEDELIGPAQAAYGRMKRGHAEFATRCGLPAASFAVAEPPGAPSGGAQGYVEAAIESAEHADDILSELQDSMLPVEVGDPELRAAIADVRTRLAEVPVRGHELLRTLGR